MTEGEEFHFRREQGIESIECESAILTDRDKTQRARVPAESENPVELHSNRRARQRCRASPNVRPPVQARQFRRNNRNLGEL